MSRDGEPRPAAGGHALWSRPRDHFRGARPVRPTAVRCDSSAAVKSRCVAAASSGVAHRNGWRIPSTPCSSSSRYAAHIWRIASEKPNSKIAPVIVGYAETEPRSTRLPGLRAARRVLHHAQRLRLLRGVRDRACPCRRSRSPRCSSRRERSASSRSEAGTHAVGALHVAEQHRVVPGVARHRPAAPVGPLRNDVADRIARTSRGAHPARSGRWSACIPRSPMQPYSPLKRAIRFQLIGLPGRGRSSAGTASAPRSRGRSAVPGSTSPPPGRRDRRAAPTSSGRAAPGCSASSALIASFAARSIPKGFSPRRCFPARSAATYDLLVQVVRHGDSRRPRRGRRRAGRGSRRRAAARARGARTTRARRGSCRRRRTMLGPDAELGEMDPARRRARELPAHQAAADDAERRRPVRSRSEKRERVGAAGTPSWTIAISAPVIAAGLSCWITLRP